MQGTRLWPRSRVGPVHRRSGLFVWFFRFCLTVGVSGCGMCRLSQAFLGCDGSEDTRCAVTSRLGLTGIVCTGNRLVAARFASDLALFAVWVGGTLDLLSLTLAAGLPRRWCCPLALVWSPGWLCRCR